VRWASDREDKNQLKRNKRPGAARASMSGSKLGFSWSINIVRWKPIILPTAIIPPNPSHFQAVIKPMITPRGKKDNAIISPNVGVLADGSEPNRCPPTINNKNAMLAKLDILAIQRMVIER
jgi:hypothetical protein